MKLKKYREAADFLKGEINEIPDTLCILGSGLGFLGDELEEAVTIAYGEIPHFKESTVDSHKGQLVFGRLAGKSVAIMQGRFHFYEGYSFEDTVFPVRVLKLLGAKNLFVTNAAGGINKSYEAGDLMLICDHIKLFDESPLRGKNIGEFGTRFPDMSYAYDPHYLELAKKVAEELSIKLHEGVYAFMPGPQFETPAEIRMLRALGADAVGMSTVAEVIAGVHCSMRVVGISCISNLAAGITSEPLSDDDVVVVANREKEKFSRLVKAILERM